MTDAFGNALGNSLADSIGTSNTQENLYNLAAGIPSGQGLKFNAAGQGPRLSASAQNAWSDEITQNIQANAAALAYRNGGDIASDNFVNPYTGPNRTETFLTVQTGDTTSGLAKQIYGQQWRAGMALMMRDNNLRTNQWGSPIIERGQTISAWDLGAYNSDQLAAVTQIGNAALANNAQGLNAKAALEAKQLQQQAAAYTDTDGFHVGPSVERAKALGIYSGSANANAYPEMRESKLSARETATNWVRTTLGGDRAANVFAGAVSAWLATPEAVSKLPDALGNLPSAISNLASSAASSVKHLWNDPLGTASNTLASGVDGFRNGFNQIVYGDGQAAGSALFALGTAFVPLGRIEGANSVLMNSGGDRLISTMGAARINNAVEYNAIINNLKVKGVDISYREGQFAYGPAPSAGRPGNIVFDPNSSLSAIKHEYGHFLDDAALGFPGQRYYYENPSARLATERRQYLGEVRTARELGDATAHRQLIEDYLGEKKYLINNYYTKPYGSK